MSTPPTIRSGKNLRRLRRRGPIAAAVSLWRNGSTNPDQAWPAAYWRPLRFGFLMLVVFIPALAITVALLALNTRLLHRFGSWPIVPPGLVFAFLVATPHVRASQLLNRAKACGFSLCPECGYSLAELGEAGTCLECGKSFTRFQVIRVWKRALGKVN